MLPQKPVLPMQVLRLEPQKAKLALKPEPLREKLAL